MDQASVILWFWGGDVHGLYVSRDGNKLLSNSGAERSEAEAITVVYCGLCANAVDAGVRRAWFRRSGSLFRSGGGLSLPPNPP